MTENEKITYALIAILRACGKPIGIKLDFFEESLKAKGELKIELALDKEAIFVSFRECGLGEFAEKYPDKLTVSQQVEMILKKKEDGR